MLDAETLGLAYRKAVAQSVNHVPVGKCEFVKRVEMLSANPEELSLDMAIEVANNVLDINEYNRFLYELDCLIHCFDDCR